jgi:hypothetical protein
VIDVQALVTEPTFRILGQPATFRPREGGAFPVTVIVRQSTDLAPDAFGAVLTDVRDVVDFMVRDVPRPHSGDLVDVDERTFRIDSIFQNDGYTISVVVSRGV